MVKNFEYKEKLELNFIKDYFMIHPNYRLRDKVLGALAQLEKDYAPNKEPEFISDDDYERFVSASIAGVKCLCSLFDPFVGICTGDKQYQFNSYFSGKINGLTHTFESMEDFFDKLSISLRNHEPSLDLLFMGLMLHKLYEPLTKFSVPDDMIALPGLSIDKQYILATDVCAGWYVCELKYGLENLLYLIWKEVNKLPYYSYGGLLREMISLFESYSRTGTCGIYTDDDDCTTVIVVD